MAALPRTKEELKAALPDTSKTLHLPDLDATVGIYRDGYGIPHVRAQSAHDAFFGQGFATAQDRLWHMDQDRRWAYGSWAEYAGPGALEQDLMMRRFMLRASVKSDYQAVNDETRTMLDAYAAGVNAFIESTESLPIEYALVEARPERWQPWDCLAVFKARHILMGVFESKLWRARLVSELGAQKAAQLLPGHTQGHLLIVPPGAEYDGPENDALRHLSSGAEAVNRVDYGSAGGEDGEAGSNNWAVSGVRTASGKPLLAGDPHRGLDTPNVYYQNHVSCPDFDVVGLSFPGCPGFPHFGHNADVAWCVTHAAADYQDLYMERFKEGSPSIYDYQGEWREAEVHHEVIEVKGAPSVELDVTVTQHGPVIVGDPASGHAVAFKYTATAGPNLGLQPLRRMLEATSADELEESMRDWTDPCNNFLFIDVHGDIGYLNRGKLPVRSMANAWLPVPGWTGDHEWQGFVPFEELVRSRNPDNGYIVTANNRIVGDDYPHYIALNFAPDGYRARRIFERLKGLDDATVQDMAAIHAEKVSIPGRTYARLLSQVEPLDEPSIRAKEYLAGWDGTMDRDSVAPTLYSAFRIQLDRAILDHLLGPLAGEAVRPDSRGAPAYLSQIRSLFGTMAVENDATMLPPGTDWNSLMAEALAEGVSYLRNRLGDAMDSWTWGRVHFTKHKHPLSASFPEVAPLLNPPSLPMGGDGDTPQSGSYSPTAPFTMAGSSVARYVFDAGDWNNSAWIVPLGASGHPASPHYSDQAPTWGEVKLIPMLYDWDRIQAGAESLQELKPGK